MHRTVLAVNNHPHEVLAGKDEVLLDFPGEGLANPDKLRAALGGAEG